MGYTEWDELVQAIYFMTHPYTDDAKKGKWLSKILPLIHSIAVTNLKASKSIIQAIENSIEELNPDYYDAVIVQYKSDSSSPRSLTEEEIETEEDSDSDYETESDEESEEDSEEDLEEDFDEDS